MSDGTWTTGYGGRAVPPMPTEGPRSAPEGPIPQPEAARGQDSINPLWLEGWDRFSTWGYDTGTSSYYVQLYRVTDDRDAAPRIWLGVSEPITQLPVLFLQIALATREPMIKVYEALLHDPDGVPEAYRHVSDPVSPAGITLDQAHSHIREVRDQYGEEPYARGVIDALYWVLGEQAEAPDRTFGLPDGTGTVGASGRPTPLAIATEAWSASAAASLFGSQGGRTVGAETALLWSVGLTSTTP